MVTLVRQRLSFIVELSNCADVVESQRFTASVDLTIQLSIRIQGVRVMFTKRRKVANFNNNSFLDNENYPFNKNVQKFCLQHKFDCDGNSKEVKI